MSEPESSKSVPNPEGVVVVDGLKGDPENVSPAFYNRFSEVNSQNKQYRSEIASRNEELQSLRDRVAAQDAANSSAEAAKSGYDLDSVAKAVRLAFPGIDNLSKITSVEAGMKELTRQRMLDEVADHKASLGLKEIPESKRGAFNDALMGMLSPEQQRATATGDSRHVIAALDSIYRPEKSVNVFDEFRPTKPAETLPIPPTRILSGGIGTAAPPPPPKTIEEAMASARARLGI